MGWDILHAGLGWPMAALLLAVSVVSSFITAAFGIGGGTVMLAVLALVLPAPAIIPVHGMVQLGSNTGRFSMLARHAAFALFPAFAVGALIGVALGGALVVQLPAAWVQIGVGGFVLWSVLARPPGFLKRSGMLAGAVSSFLTMFFGGTGPFVAVYVRAQALDRQSYVATHAMLMTLQHALKTVMFGFLGFAFAGWGLLIVGIIAAGLVGTALGRAVLLRIDEKRFRMALNVLLTLLALRLIQSGLFILSSG
jgi:uncharacterized protein